MNGLSLYQTTTFECSRRITQLYSTSFTLGIKTLHPRFHDAIYGIYGFVRYADEIVDTFHDYNKKNLLTRFRQETFQAIEDKISLNPVLHSFQTVVNHYQVDHSLIVAFLDSMEMDLESSNHNLETYDQYIFGSAEVVGLMCLKVFVEGDQQKYEELLEPARKLGAAFQKVNFLRDIRSDFEDRGRVYFPGVDFSNFTLEAKKSIEMDIQKDFDEAFQGIIKLPRGARLGVYLAYIYYMKLFQKIKHKNVTTILNQRVRVPDQMKLFLLVQSYCKHKLNFL